MKDNTIFGGRVSFPRKIRYAMGGACDSLPYALFYTYFMLYLTDVAGINSVIAGIIAGAAAFMDGFIDPTLGIYSDNLYRRTGTRRTAMIQGLIPLCIVTILLFAPINFGSTVTIIWYVIISLGFVTCYSLLTMNFVAMGGEMTDNYNERNMMRLIVSLGSPIWNYIGKGGPAIVENMFPDMDLKPRWFIVAIVCTLVYLVFTIVVVTMAKSAKQVKEMRARGEVDIMYATEDDAAAEEEIAKIDLFKNLKSALSLSALRSQVIMVLCFSMANGFVYALIAYVLDYTVGLTAAQKLVFWGAASVTNWIALFLGTILANTFGKKLVFVGGFGFAAICCLVFLITGMETLTKACIFIIAWTLVETPFWQFYCTNGYEIADLDEFAFGKRRTSMILSIASFVLKLGPTLSLLTTGTLLALIGYVEGGVEQSAETIRGLHLYITILPTVFLGCGAIAFAKYPINKNNHAALVKALEAKKKGEAYSTDGFRELLPADYKE